MTTEFGPPIPHVPGKPCPFPDAVGLVKWSDCEWDTWKPCPLRDWSWHEYEPELCITHYRLPADHHAYGPRVSRMGREPDYWINDYPIGGVGMENENRAEADTYSGYDRIGIWRIYLKGDCDEC